MSRVPPPRRTLIPTSRSVDRAPVWHHVVRRRACGGGGRGDLAATRERLELLAGVESRFGVEVHAFCLMGTHDHLLLRATGTGLVPALRWVDGTRGGSSQLVPVRAARHALQASRYIHRNPVAAGLVARAEDWPWSSYRGYLNPPQGPPWLRISTILARFGAIGAHARYRAFVEAGSLGGRDDFHAVGGFPGVSPDGLPGAGIAVPLAAIARVIAASFGCDPAALRVRPGRAGDAELVARGAFVIAARRRGGWPRSVIAAWLGYASATGPVRAAARFDAAAAADPGLRQRLQRALDTLSC